MEAGQASPGGRVVGIARRPQNVGQWLFFSFYTRALMLMARPFFQVSTAFSCALEAGFAATARSSSLSPVAVLSPALSLAHSSIVSKEAV